MPRGSGARPRNCNSAAGRGDDEGEELPPRAKVGKSRAPPPPDIEAPAEGNVADKMKEQALAMVDSHKKTSTKVYYVTLALMMIGVAVVVLLDIRKKASGKNAHRLRVPKGI